MSELEKHFKEAQEFYNSPEGKALITEIQTKSTEEIAKFRKNCQITPEDLQRRITI